MEIKQFFDPIKKPKKTKLRYNNTSTLIAMCDVFSRVNNVSAYIIDYAKQEFLHVSPHPLFLCGYQPEDVKKMGYSFYEKVVPPEDIEMLLEINQMGWDFFYKSPPEERMFLRISYNFYLSHQEGGKVLVNHKLAPLCLTADGNIWLAICFVSYSPYKEPGNVVFTKNGENEYYEYDLNNQKIVKYSPKKLTKREEEVMHLTLRGYEENQISDQLHISLHTIKNHRRNIEKKYGVKNMSNAIAMFYSLF